MKDDLDNSDVAEFYRMKNTLNTLRDQCISCSWSQGFTDTLLCATGMRTTKVNNATTKEVLRNWSGSCMACGKKECANDTIIHLAGTFKKDAFQRFDTLSDEWNDYVEDYNECLEIGENAKRSMNEGELFHQDHGVFVLGKQCTRLASLVYICNSFWTDMVFSAIQTVKERRQARSPVKNNRYYTCDEDDIFLHLTSLDTLKSHVASNNELSQKAVPEDASFWKSIDASRRYAGCNDTTWIVKMLSTRALEKSKRPDFAAREDDLVTTPDDEDLLTSDEENLVTDEVDGESSTSSTSIATKRPAEQPVEAQASKKTKTLNVATNTENNNTKTSNVATNTENNTENNTETSNNETSKTATKTVTRSLLKAQVVLIASGDLEVAALVSEALVSMKNEKTVFKALLKAQQILISKANVKAAALVSEALVEIMS